MITKASQKWDTYHFGMFVIASCAISWLLVAFALIAPADISIAHIRTPAILLIGASLAPGLIGLAAFKEARLALRKFKAPPWLFATAFFLGAVLPFTAQFGCRDTAQFWPKKMLWDFTRVLLLNLFLSPLWEEIAWRGVFYQKFISAFPLKRAILGAALGWTIWHLGFLSYLYKSGIPANILLYLPIQYFCIGITLIAIFKMSAGALWPCIIFHAAFNASVTTYFNSGNKVLDLHCYIAETLAICIVAIVAFLLVGKSIQTRAESVI